MKLVYRIHKGTALTYKSCYVLADEGKVLEAEEPMKFAVGWTVQKLRERASGKGYTVTLQVGMSKIPNALGWGAAPPKKPKQRASA